MLPNAVTSSLGGKAVNDKDICSEQCKRADPRWHIHLQLHEVALKPFQLGTKFGVLLFQSTEPFH
jgi:hypothetical protein